MAYYTDEELARKLQQELADEELAKKLQDEWNSQPQANAALPVVASPVIVQPSRPMINVKSGEIYGWGSNAYGQLAIGSNSTTIPAKIKLPSEVPVKQIDCGFYHSIALLEDGSLYSWGRTMEGQLGLGKDVLANAIVAEPMKIKIDFIPVQISCGRYHTSALDQYGQVYETGRDTEFSFSLVKMATNDKIQQIASGGVWSYALTESGDVYRWGGLVREENRKVAKLKDIPTLVRLIGGFGAVTGITQTGDVWRYGDQGSVSSSRNLVRMEVSGLNTAASLDVSGVLTAWKCDPVSRKPVSSPTDVGGVFSGHYGREISAGDHHVVVLGAHVAQKIPRVFCFGTSNTYGQLGSEASREPNNTALSLMNPVEIKQLEAVELAQVRCGGYHTLVLAGNWIGSNAGLSNELRAARTGDLLTDMEFHVNGTVFKAHKALVSARCLRHKKHTLQMDLKKNSVVNVEHVTPEDFATFMEFLYTDSCPIDRAQIKGLENLADLFGIERLKVILQTNPKLNKKRALHEVPNLADDMVALLSTADFSDISFDIEGKLVPAHKFVLAARCPYYNALWRQGWQESRQSVLHLGEEIAVNSFKHFLKYIYTDIFDVDGDSVLDVLKLSQKIQMSSLKNLCERFVSGSVDVDNVCGLYQLASELNTVVIKNVCLNFLEKESKNSSVQRDLKELPPDVRKEIENHINRSRSSHSRK